uniref:Reverse transcriptase domain-containing protein n=1 Tax=Graphocephala atropunctata TaxID=36148 RepID=A0A1B6KRH3_9HEMI
MALRWFQSYLSNRHQVVEIVQSIKGIRTTARSDSQPITREVPQGSVLGPLLFVLSTNDLPAVTEPYFRAIMYADDTVILTFCKSVESLEINPYIGLNGGLLYEARSRVQCLQDRTGYLW